MTAIRGREQRRRRRTRKRSAAWIELASGSTHIPCVLWDISESGARIAAPRAKSLPIAFILRLTKDGQSQRVCRVVWRSEGYLGVQFIENATLEDVLDAGALRQLPKIIGEDGATPSSEALALLLPGCGPGLSEQMNRQGRPLSWSAAAMTAALLVATVVLALAGAEADAPWAMAVCGSTQALCQHPEWTGIAGALMAVVFLSARGMEL